MATPVRVHGKKGRLFYISGSMAVEVWIKSWEATQNAAPADATTNADGGYTNSEAGNLAMKGNAAGLLDKNKQANAQPFELQAGQSVSLRLYPTDGTGYWNVPALISEVTNRVSNTECVAWTFSFENKGAFNWVPQA